LQYRWACSAKLCERSRNDRARHVDVHALYTWCRSSGGKETHNGPNATDKQASPWLKLSLVGQTVRELHTGYHAQGVPRRGFGRKPRFGVAYTPGSQASRVMRCGDRSYLLGAERIAGPSNSHFGRCQPPCSPHGRLPRQSRRRQGEHGLGGEQDRTPPRTSISE